MKKITILLILSIIYSCNKENPTGNEPIDSTAKDTLSREIIEDVFLRVDSLKDVYTLDENIFADVHLKNENNLNGVPIFIGNWPPFLSWIVKNSNGDFVCGGPTIIYDAVFDDTLKTGEEITDNITWFQTVVDENDMFSGLKAFSGNYCLEINFRGIEYENYPHLLKYFKITETGDPLSYQLARDYNPEDSIKIDFILRNRISSEIVLNTSDDSSGIFIVKTNNTQAADTVYSNKFLPEYSVYNLAPFSDNTLYRFSYLEQDFVNQGIKGAFNLVIRLNFREKIFISGYLLFIH